MIKIAHEAPVDIFEEVQRVTDYDYAFSSFTRTKWTL